MVAHFLPERERESDGKRERVSLQAEGDECYLSLPTIECLTPFHKASFVISCIGRCCVVVVVFMY